jgi:hypothetical protein
MMDARGQVWGLEDVSDLMRRARAALAAAPEMFEALANLYHRTIVGTDEQRHAALDEAWRVLVKARTAVEGPSVGTSNASEPKNTPANGDSQ